MARSLGVFGCLENEDPSIHSKFDTRPAIDERHALGFTQIIEVDSTVGGTMVCKETSMQHIKVKSKTEMLVEYIGISLYTHIYIYMK